MSTLAAHEVITCFFKYFFWNFVLNFNSLVGHTFPLRFVAVSTCNPCHRHHARESYMTEMSLSWNVLRASLIYIHMYISTGLKRKLSHCIPKMCLLNMSHHLWALSTQAWWSVHVICQRGLFSLLASKCNMWNDTINLQPAWRMPLMLWKKKWKIEKLL